ncbi:MAG: AraC family transcriptional regulator [Planctomycetaceae bacterium]|nr:AraC family transcriptional regulator [Planctomycetaceae bacterium]
MRQGLKRASVLPQKNIANSFLYQPGRNYDCWMCDAVVLPALERLGIEKVYIVTHCGKDQYREPSFPCYLVSAQVRGAGASLFDGTWHMVSAPGVHLCCPGQQVQTHSVGRPPHQFVQVRYRADCEDPIVRGITSQQVLSADIDSLRLAAEGLRHEHQTSGNQHLMAHWAGLIDVCAKELIDRSRPPSRLRPVWKAVDADLTHRWTLDEMSEIVNLSVQHLRRVSIAETGVSPMRYVARLRLERAAILIRSERTSIERVAWAVGFSTRHAFTRAFIRHFGTTPGRFRQQMKG